MRLKAKYLMSYQDIQLVLHSTMQYIVAYIPDWTRYGMSQLKIDGTIEHTSWRYEYVSSDNTHKISIQEHKDTDTYDVEILGASWINTYQGFSNYRYERFAIVYVLEALLDMDKNISNFNKDQIQVLRQIIDGHLNSESWDISKLYI